MVCFYLIWAKISWQPRARWPQQEGQETTALIIVLAISLRSLHLYSEKMVDQCALYLLFNKKNCGVSNEWRRESLKNIATTNGECKSSNSDSDIRYCMIYVQLALNFFSRIWHFRAIVRLFTKEVSHGGRLLSGCFYFILCLPMFINFIWLFLSKLEQIPIYALELCWNYIYIYTHIDRYFTLTKIKTNIYES